MVINFTSLTSRDNCGWWYPRFEIYRNTCTIKNIGRLLTRRADSRVELFSRHKWNCAGSILPAFFSRPHEKSAWESSVIAPGCVCIFVQLCIRQCFIVLVYRSIAKFLQKKCVTLTGHTSSVKNFATCRATCTTLIASTVYDVRTTKIKRRNEEFIHCVIVFSVLNSDE